MVDSPYGSNSVDEIHQVLAFVKSMMDFSVGIYEHIRNGEVGRLTVLEESASELSESSLSALSALYEQNKEAQRANATHEYETFRETIRRLEVPLGNLDHDGGLPSIFMWIFLCPTPFFDLISQRDPLALIVLAHYCVALHQHRSIWWVSSWGYRVLDTIYKTLDHHLRYLLTWPVREIGYKGED
jgi:hypothetical protein